MGGGMSAPKPGPMIGLRIVVAGDHGTGKSSLISTAIPANDPPVLPEVPSVLAPIRLPDDMFPYCVPITVIDTSSSLQHRDELAEELKTADAIVVTCSYDQLATLDLDHRLCTFWLKYLQDLQVKAPVVVAFCKSDIKQPIHLPKLMLPILQRYPQLENYLECSAKLRTLTPDIFLYAQKAVLFPTPPLYDRETKTLKPRCLRALIGVFTLFDSDKDGCLSDKEFNDLQAKCFGTPMEDIKVQCVKSCVEKIMPEGAVIDNKLTLRGFLTNHAELIEHHHPEITWTILKKNEYDNEIKFCCDRLLPPIKRTLDQSVELTTEALEHLRRVFSLFDIRGDGASNARELEDLFSTQPSLDEAPSVEVNVLGELSVTGFLSKWALMALLNPVLTVEILKDMGYAGNPTSAVKVTQRRRVDRSDRNVFQCFVFGAKEAGKSSLMHAFVGRPFSQDYTPTIEERYAVNIVDFPDGRRKTLILREIPEDATRKLLTHKDALAACDIAVFVYDSASATSSAKATELLVQVESTGYVVPCLIVAAKCDLVPFATTIQDTTRVSMGIEVPIPIIALVGLAYAATRDKPCDHPGPHDDTRPTVLIWLDI
uniref:Mitochondrial Rho GTPase n=1 Tax=Lactuca sativa TaxID=4236 RepID=A0A9R1VK00_LACSA|nr:hypothetical protein LSAT_V11C500260340 [Lactuca sativa]